MEVGWPTPFLRGGVAMMDARANRPNPRDSILSRTLREGPFRVREPRPCIQAMPPPAGQPGRWTRQREPLTGRRESMLSQPCPLTSQRESLLSHRSPLTSQRRQMLSQRRQMLSQRRQMLSQRKQLLSRRRQTLKQRRPKNIVQNHPGIPGHVRRPFFSGGRRGEGENAVRLIGRRRVACARCTRREHADPPREGSGPAARLPGLPVPRQRPFRLSAVIQSLPAACR